MGECASLPAVCAVRKLAAHSHSSTAGSALELSPSQELNLTIKYLPSYKESSHSQQLLFLVADDNDVAPGMGLSRLLLAFKVGFSLHHSSASISGITITATLPPEMLSDCMEALPQTELVPRVMRLI